MREETQKRYFPHENCKLAVKLGGNNVNGKKVVATVPLEKGDFVCFVCGKFYKNTDSFTPRPGKIHGEPVEEAFSFEYDSDTGTSVDPGFVHAPKTNKVKKHISGFINHSCNPNCEFYFDEDKEMLVIVAKDTIDVGEEITISYGKTWFEDHGVFCQCGEENCKFCKEKALAKEEIEYAEEGKNKEIEINVYNRDPDLRDQVAKKSKYRCQVCGKKLTEMYGGYGANLIHVHHQISLASRKGRSTRTYAKDLIAVCPNCHAVLHNMEKYPTENTTDRLKKTIRRRREKKEKE